MPTALDALAVVAVLTNGVVYGTDVFAAVVLRPAVAAVDDRTLTQLLGHVHRIADRRFPVIGAVGLVSTAALAVLATVGGHLVAAVAGAVAVVALVAFLVVYARVSAPVNAVLTAEALADRVPAEARVLQARWDSVITARVVLQTVALVALCVALAAP